MQLGLLAPVAAPSLLPPRAASLLQLQKLAAAPPDAGHVHRGGGVRADTWAEDCPTAGKSKTRWKAAPAFPQDQDTRAWHTVGAQ